MSITTRAAVLRQEGLPLPYAHSRPLSVEEVRLADPGPEEVLIRIAAAGLCHSDLSVVNGDGPRPLPMVLGHEAAGIVEETGVGVTGLRAGDRVVCSYVPSCGLCSQCGGGQPVLCPSAQAANREARLLSGGRPFHDGAGPLNQHLGVSAFAELTVVSQRSLIRVPDEIPLDVAAVFGCAVLTGMGAVLNTGNVRPGDAVAVFGLGGVGLSAVMAAVLVGAHPVIAVDTIAAKLDAAKSLGATDTFLAGDDTPEQIRDRTGGGVDWAVEAAGSAPALAAGFQATRPGGTVIVAGLPNPRHTIPASIASLVGEQKTVRGSYMGSAVPRRDLPRLFALHASGRLPAEALLTSRSVPLAGINTALDRLHQGTEVRQVIVPGR
jgi:alcohol dehydrogenase